MTIGAGVVFGRQDYAAAFEPYLRAIPTRFQPLSPGSIDANNALQAIQKPALEMGVDH
jgi:hypothetical protein